MNAAPPSTLLLHFIFVPSLFSVFLESLIYIYSFFSPTFIFLFIYLLIQFLALQRYILHCGQQLTGGGLRGKLNYIKLN